MLTSHMTHMLQNISKLKIPTIFSHHPLQDIFKPSSPQLSRSDALVITQSGGFLSSLGAITQSVPQMIQQKLQVATWFWWWFPIFPSKQVTAWRPTQSARLIVVECIDFALEGLLQAILQVESIGQRLCGQPMKILSAWESAKSAAIAGFFFGSQVTYPLPR